MPRLARLSLALALAWAGGLASLGPGGVWTLTAAAVLAGLTLTWICPAPIAAGDQGRWHRGLERLALLALLAILIQILIATLVEVPAAAIGLVIASVIAFGLWVVKLRGASVGPGTCAALIGVGALAAVLLGASLGASRGVAIRGAVYGGPLLGAHPGQAIALRIDGHGPHDIVTPDYVEAHATEGLDGHAWASWIEDQLHQIAVEHYAEGPARAREAYAHARVEVGARGEATSIHSGTTGAGSSVEVVCPSRSFDPRPRRPSPSRAACPTKYQADGTTGLGLSRRWPGYVEVPGRPSLAIPPALGLGLAGLGLAGLLVALSRRRPADPSWPVTAAGLIGLSCVLALVLALLVPTPARNIAEFSPTGPGMLAVVLLCAGARSSPTGARRLPEFVACVGLAMLLASPLVGLSPAQLRAGLVERQVLGLDLPWSVSVALAAFVTAIVLAIGAGICATALARPSFREPQHTSFARIGPALAAIAGAIVGAALLASRLRKDGDLTTLLTSAAALYLAASLSAPSRAKQLGLSAICAAAPATALVFGEPDLGVAAAALVCAIACLALGLCQPSSAIDRGDQARGS